MKQEHVAWKAATMLLKRHDDLGNHSGELATPGRERMTMKNWVYGCLLFIAGVSSSAHACSLNYVTDPQKIKAGTKKIYSEAIAIVDLQILEPANYRNSKKFKFTKAKVIRSFKGNLREGRIILIPFYTTCDYLPGKENSQVRLLLGVENGFLNSGLYLNGGGFDSVIFNREIDRILKSDRKSLNVS
ncbi:hypothetical protein [Sphingobium sp.]|uniref:hypothetical protein n=1 Tax=Sphingobium sp. TaxID=1912891 RepID=UPI003BB61372